MLTNWSKKHSEGFGEETIIFGHSLRDSGLFTDEALIALMKRHPTDQMDVCSMSDDSDPEFLNQFMTGDFRGVPPKVLLEAAKDGRIFMNLRNAMNIHSEYKVLLDQMFGELSEKTGFENFKAKGSILISSPISQTPYHFDKTQTILWHVRGKKRMYIYPMTPKFIPDEAYEATALSYRVDDLPYDVSFDQSAQICDLVPGEAVAWPLNAPHRVDNGSFCVSVTTEYSTRECVIKNNNMVANAAIRRKLGLKPNYHKDGDFKRMAKAGVGVFLRKTGYIERNDEPDMVSFKIDPKAKGFVVRTEPFIRDF
ncbi:MAG: hypothetical protein ABJ275_00410 [Maricaulaceae bacterium]